MIDDLRLEYPLPVLCQTLDVALSGYYAWRKRTTQQAQAAGQSTPQVATAEPAAASAALPAAPQPKRRWLSNAVLGEEVTQLFVRHQGRYGSPRIRAALFKANMPCSRKRVARLMRNAGLVARPLRSKRLRTTYAVAGATVAPNLLAQNFTATAPNQKWVSDFTYVPINDEWLFVCVVLDLFSRKVIGWSFAASMTVDLTIAALRMALQQRKPPATCLFHSDQGSQYVAHDFQSLLRSGPLICSMSRTANCYDNAVSESFFSSFKAEVIEGRNLTTRTEVQFASLLWLAGYYNCDRLHSTLGYNTPDQFERDYYQSLVAA